MPKFKGYNKKATSDKMMRIIKRERIVSMILGNASLTKANKEFAEEKYSKYKDVDPKVFKWKVNNLTVMTITEPKEFKDYFDWKVRMIKETGWLKPTRKESLLVEYMDTRKLRIFRKWIFKGNKKCLRDILKYMYSPLFLAILIMEVGELKDDKLYLNFECKSKEDIILLKQWFNEILHLNISFNENYFFEKEETSKALELAKPIIKNIKSKYKIFYS